MSEQQASIKKACSEHRKLCMAEKRIAELEAENKRLREAIDYLNPDYYMGISVCECSSEYPIGSCLYCDMQGLKQALARSDDTVARSDDNITSSADSMQVSLSESRHINGNHATKDGCAPDKDGGEE